MRKLRDAGAIRLSDSESGDLPITSMHALIDTFVTASQKQTCYATKRLRPPVYSMLFFVYKGKGAQRSLE